MNMNQNKAIVLSKYPLSYSTWGVAMFTNQKEYRIEDGTGVGLATKCSSENKAWASAARLVAIQLAKHQKEQQ